MERSWLPCWCCVLLLVWAGGCSSGNDGKNDAGPACATAADCEGKTWPEDCEGYWECVASRCEAVCTVACTTAEDCQGEPWPENAGCTESLGRWACAGDICQATCPVITFSTRTEVDTENAGFQIDIEATPEGQFAVAYFKRLETVGRCEEPILGDTYTETQQDQVRYARFDGTTWSVEDVATVNTVFLTGISLVFDGATPLIAYLGGTPLGGLQVCGGTDLIVAHGPGSWTEDIAVAVSNEAAAGDDCPGMQGICDFGDVVGLWPTMAKAPDGTIGVAYRDIHNGYTKDADDSADLEYAFGHVGSWGHEWIDLGRGGGDFPSLAFRPDNEPAVAYYNGEQNMNDGTAPILFATRPFGDYTQRAKPCSTSADCPNGQACDGNECICSTDAQCESPKRCVIPHGICSVVVDGMERGLPEHSVSLAVGPDGRYLLAYYDVDEKNLMIAHSEDGLNWARGLVDSNGNVGRFPSLAIDPSDGKPVLAYYRCNEYHPNEWDCDRNHDGVYFAYFAGAYPAELTNQAKWKKTVVSEDSGASDGLFTSLAVGEDGTVGIAYQYSWVDPQTMETRNTLMFQQGTWE